MSQQHTTTQAMSTSGVVKRTKSILKSPSTISEKSIHFDDNVDIIQIERNSKTPSPSPSPQRRPNEQRGREYSPTNELDDLPRAQRIKETSATPVSTLNHRLQRNPSRNSRVFVKSPTPIREIPSLSNLNATTTTTTTREDGDLVESDNNSNKLSLNTKEIQHLVDDMRNRNRFVKKKLALRSQSVEFSRLIDQSNRVQNSDLPNREDELTSDRPNLMRQNAFTKSLGDNLDKVGRSTLISSSVNKQRVQDLVKTPTISVNDDLKSQKRNVRSHHHHHHHHRGANRRHHSKTKRYHARHRSHHRANENTSPHSDNSSINENLANSTTTSSSSCSSSSSLSSELTPNEEDINEQSPAQLYDNKSHLTNRFLSPNFNTNKNLLKMKKSSLSTLSLLHKKVDYSSDDSVCGIPKPGLRLVVLCVLRHFLFFFRN